MTSNDLGVKIGSVEEKAWSDILKKVESDVKAAYREIDINLAIGVLAQKKINEEKAKFK